MAAFLLKTTLHPQGNNVISEKETAMNITTLSNIPSKNIKRIKGQYVAAIAGVALAFSAVVALGPNSKATMNSVAPTRHALSADIAASVLSTELASFVTPEFSSFISTAQVNRTSAEDIAASVRSTENA